MISNIMFQNTRSLGNLTSRKILEQQFIDAASEICQKLVDDNSEEADSKFDTIWASLDSDEYSIELTELSSRLNPNFDRISFWTETNLKSRFKSTISLNDWQNQRIIQFGKTAEEFNEIYFEEDWDSLFSLYTLINANSAPMEVIEGYLRQTSVPEDKISSILSQIRSKRNNSDFISQQDLSGWMPSINGKEMAVLNSQSKMNVNFIDPMILDAVLSHPWSGKRVDNYLVMKNNILNARNTNELTDQDLRNLLTCDEEIEDSLMQYLGDTSWFWQLTLENETAALTLILCRVPSMDDMPEKSVIQIVNKRFIIKGET